jgi:membrane-associated phospholipid phosphatase
VPVTLAIVAAGVVTALIVIAASRATRRPGVIDPETEERWLVAWLARHRSLADRVRRVDASVVGGAFLVSALVVTFVTALTVGLLADMVDRNAALARWDRSIADWGSERATDTSTDVLDAVTDLGGAVTVTVIAVVVGSVELWRRRDLHVAAFLAAVLIGVSAVNNALKLIVGRERPDVVHLVEASGNSFPSGHSATAAAAWCAFALVITRDRSRRVRIVAAGLAALVIAGVAASRALLGVHWFTDVVAGVALGWGWFLLCALAFGGRLQRLGEPADRLAQVEPAGRETGRVTVDT